MSVTVSLTFGNIVPFPDEFDARRNTAATIARAAAIEVTASQGGLEESETQHL